jgi:hypothetical protein
MIGMTHNGVRALVLSVSLVPLMGVTGPARADDPAQCTGRQVVVTRARPRPVRSSGAPLGTFQPTPYLWVGGSYPTGSGYTPMDTYGDQTLALYGPLSPLRVSTAPLVVYSRGYDGQVRRIETNSFSYPNLPEVSPVIYPTEANYFYGPRVPRQTRWGSSAINWIDQN